MPFRDYAATARNTVRARLTANPLLAEVPPARGDYQQRTSDRERDAGHDHPGGRVTKERYLGRHQPDAGEQDE